MTPAEKKKARDRRKYLKRKERKKNDPDFAEKIREANRKRYANRSDEQKEKDKEKQSRFYNGNKERLNKKRTILRRDNRERELEQARKRYHLRRDYFLKQIKERRKRNDPTIGIYSAIQSFSAGSLELSELVKLFDRANEDINAQYGKIFRLIGQASFS